MSRFLHSVVVQDQAISADGIQSFMLPPNPISVLLVALRPLNATSSAGDYRSFLGILSAINRLTVFHTGISVVSASGPDLGALLYFRHGMLPNQGNPSATDNERRCVVLPVLFGRTAYNGKECLPGAKRGDLTLELDLDIADTGYDGLRLSVEAIELPGANPSSFERVLTQAVTPAGTGLFDFDLPIGSKLRGILAFGSTIYTGASPAPTLGRLELLLDNQQYGYNGTDFEVSRAISTLLGGQPPAYDDRVTATASNITNVGGGGFENYTFLDLDPTRDGEYVPDLSAVKRAVLRSDIETADACRILSVEQVSSGALSM